MFTDIITQWEEGLITTAEALTKIMSHPSATHGYMLDAIAGLTLKLTEREKAECDWYPELREEYEDTE